MKKVLLVIDLQPMFAITPYYSKIINYITNHSAEYDVVYATRFIVKRDTPFVNHLGYEKKFKKEVLEFPYNVLIGKDSYELERGYCDKWLKDCDVTIIGYGTNSNILATCFRLFEYGVKFQVYGKYCYSREGNKVHENALEIIEKNFGIGSVIRK